MTQTVIWDWNGTLLDDVDACITSVNRLLARRKLPLMTRERYLGIFTFPVRVYYEEMGFDFASESFADVAVEFHQAYASVVGDAPLHTDALAALQALSERGVKQTVLSALEEERLHGELKRRGIAPYFSLVFGLSDLHAHSKADRGLELVEALGTGCDQCWMIGDTVHDAEVAREMGVSCILVAAGHYSEDRLRSAGVPVVSTVLEAVDLIVGESS